MTEDTELHLFTSLCTCEPGNTKSIKNHKDNAEKVLTQISDTINQIRRIMGFEQTSTDDAILEAEFSKLIKSPMITDVSIDNNTISVTTSMISIGNCPIGEFLIEIKTTGAINVINKTQTIRYDGYVMHHPHVFNSGTVCFGNMGEAILISMRGKKISTTINLIIQFLRSCNDMEPYASYLGEFKKAAAAKKQKLVV